MQIIQLEQAATKALFETMFRERSLLPVIGAGFSKNAVTTEASVPGTDDFTRIMLSSLREHVGPDAATLERYTFSEVAEYFLNPEFVPRKASRELIRRHFIGVKLSRDKKAFLECPWPYIYTLNIDDAIEGNSVFKNKVVPNRAISDAAKSVPCVYKVHGDAADALIYDETPRIIFSTGQYVRSLTTNASMLNVLKTDLTEQNTIFVGCSLTSEIDLMFALAEYHGAFPEGRRSIYVTQKETNRFETAKLAAHGINTVLIVPDFETFYGRLADWAVQAAPRTPSIISVFQRGPGRVKRLGLDRGANLSFLLREPDPREAPGQLVLPAFHIQRDIEHAVLRACNEVPLCLVRGRRFSGRTMLLRSLALVSKARNVYYMDSNTRTSEEVLEQLLASDNSLLLFDTNSLTPETAVCLARSVRKIEERGSSAVIAVNRTEPDVVGALVRHVEDRHDFEIDARLSRSECDALNKGLDALGLLRFDCRRTLLDNTFMILEQTPQTQSELSKGWDLTAAETEVLLVVAVADKAYSSVATALDIRTADLFSLCDKLSPIVEVVTTSKGEVRDTHSRYKVIANSRSGLAKQIRSVIDSKGYQWVSERFASVVARLLDLPQFRAVGQSMYMFDAINYVLSQGVRQGAGTGYRPVVRSLYENLQQRLNNSPDYWLQRAKAVFNIEDDQASIVDGIGFALKAFREAERERTIDNAEFLIALLYGKLCAVTRFGQIDALTSAIRWFCNAIRNYERNENYIRGLLDGRDLRRNYFDQLCDYLEGPISHIELLPLKRDVDFLLSTRRSWRSRVQYSG